MGKMLSTSLYVNSDLYDRVNRKAFVEKTSRNRVISEALELYLGGVKPSRPPVEGVKKMPLVILESPYVGEVEANVAYARKAMLDSLQRGEAPIASHLLYPQVLNDLEQPERLVGIYAGLSWRTVCDYAVFYIDRGISHGMEMARDIYKKSGIEWIERTLQK